MAIDNIQPTTHLEAVNTILASVGEAPISALSSGRVDETMATQILTEVMREVQARRWRFNSEYGYSLSPSGTEGGRNVFSVPANLASWKLALIEAQRGLDIVARQERANIPAVGAWIFADRINGTDGIAGLANLVINPVWFVDFDECPQSFRTFVTILAARRFALQVVGSNQESPFGFTEEDERRAFALFKEDQQEQIPVPPLGSNPATESESLNQILTANGIPPVINLSALFEQDQFMALQILRDTDREVQSEGWRFNYESGYELPPEASTYSWVDSEAVTTVLNIFRPQTNMLTWGVTPTAEQVDVDLSIRLSTRYQDGGQFVPVFYDRLLNRDGLDSEVHEYLYLDVVRYIPWTELPETARQYITILASRRVHATRPKSQNLPWTEQDVQLARRALVKDQGYKRRRNIFDHPDMWEFRGRRTPLSYSLTRPGSRR